MIPFKDITISRQRHNHLIHDEKVIAAIAIFHSPIFAVGGSYMTLNSQWSTTFWYSSSGRENNLLI